MSITLKTYLDKILTTYRTARAAYIDVNNKVDRLQDACNKAVRSGSLNPKGIAKQKQATREAIEELRRDELQPALQKAQEDFAEIRKTVDTVFSDLYRANPERLDMPTMELLKSGILTDRELLELTEKFNGNNTMQRVLAAEAKRRYDADPSKDDLLGFSLLYSVNPNAAPAPLVAVDSLTDLCKSALREDRLLADGVAPHVDEMAAEILSQYGDIAV